MKILAIDSSTRVMGVAVVDHEKLLCEFTTNTKLNHAVRLMPAIERALSEADLKPTELDRIAVSQGPGSYTGVRIGVTIAKTLAWTLKKELVGISTLACMAQNGSLFQGLVVPFFDARRDRVYTGLYKGIEGSHLGVESDQIQGVDGWLEHLSTFDRPLLFLGPDLEDFYERIEERLGSQAVFAPMSFGLPRASELARLAGKQSPVPSIHHFVPEYLQMAEAESKWQANQIQKENLT